MNHSSCGGASRTPEHLSYMVVYSWLHTTVTSVLHTYSLNDLSLTRTADPNLMDSVSYPPFLGSILC